MQTYLKLINVAPLQRKEDGNIITIAQFFYGHECSSKQRQKLIQTKLNGFISSNIIGL